LGGAKQPKRTTANARWSRKKTNQALGKKRRVRNRDNKERKKCTGRKRKKKKRSIRDLANCGKSITEGEKRAERNGTSGVCK